MLKLFQKTSKLLSNTSYFLFCKDQTFNQNMEKKLTQNSSKLLSQQQTNSAVSSYNDDEEFHKHNDFLASQIFKEILAMNSPGDQINCVTETNLSSNNIKQGSLKKQFVPLRQRILNKIELSSVNRRSKTQFLNIFTKGVLINKKIWNQKRMQQGCIRQNGGQQICMFCPTDIVTGPIFRKIFQTLQIDQNTLENQTQTLLLSGLFGISKTFSFLLYSILSSYIIKYQFKNLNKPSVQGISKQLFKVPKLIYLSLKKPMSLKRNTQQQMQNLIKLQCQELYKNIGGLSQTGKIYKIDQIKQFYNKYGYPVIFVIDQINIIASIYRTKMLIQKELQRHNYENDVQKNNLIESLQNISKQYKQACKIIQFFGKSYAGFNLIIYLSSVTFEMQYQTEMNLSGDGGHTDVPLKNINYLEEFAKDQVKYEIADYFLFEFSQRFLRNTIHKDFIASLQQNDIKLKHQIRSKMVQTMKNNLTYFTTPHFIRKYFQTLQLQKNYIVQQPTLNKVNLSDHLVQIFKKTCKNSKKSLKHELSKFYTKRNDPTANKLILKLYAAALQKYQEINNSIDNNYLEIKLQEQNWKNIFTKIDSRIFQFDIETKMFKILLPLQLIVEVLRIQCIEIIDKLYRTSKLTHFVKQLPRETQIMMYTYHFLAILRSHNAKIIRQIINSNRIVSIYQYINIYSKHLCFNYIRPVSSLKNQGKYTLLKQLRPYFEILDSHNITTEQTFLVLPCNALKQNQYQNILQNGLQRYLNNDSIQLNCNSKQIDFLIFGFSPIMRKIQIEAYDLTIGDDDIFKRIKNFVNQFSKQAEYDEPLMKINGNQYTVELSIYVAGPKLVNFKWPQNYLNKLQQNSNGKFKFKKDETNQKIVTVSQSQKFVLKRVGAIDTIQQLVPESKSTESIHEVILNLIAGAPFKKPLD